MLFRAVTVMFAIAAMPGTGARLPVLEQQFEETVRPFVIKYCAGCHSGQTAAGQFDLKSYVSMETVTADFPHWTLLMERLAAKEMPPKPVPPPPAEANFVDNDRFLARSCWSFAR